MSWAAVNAQLMIVAEARPEADALPGLCYSNAIHYIERHSGQDWTVVHGIQPMMIEGPGFGQDFGHAWLERAVGDEQWIFDPTSGVVLPAQMVYHVARISYTARYTTEQALINTLLHRTHGPWDARIMAAKHTVEKARHPRA
jgi:hypothetical protein